MKTKINKEVKLNNEINNRNFLISENTPFRFSINNVSSINIS